MSVTIEYIYYRSTRKFTAVLVVELNGTGASLGNGEATGLGLDVLDFVPSLLGDVLGHQRVGRLDGGEFSRHDLTLWT